MTYNSQSDSEKEEQSWRVRLPYFKIYYKTSLMKTKWHRRKDKQIEQWSRLERTESNSEINIPIEYFTG